MTKVCILSMHEDATPSTIPGCTNKKKSPKANSIGSWYLLI